MLNELRGKVVALSANFNKQETKNSEDVNSQSETKNTITEMKNSLRESKVKSMKQRIKSAILKIRKQKAIRTAKRKLKK